jgi:hypothetical protein
MTRWPERGNLVSDLSVICPYCNENAELVDSDLVYWKSFGMIWLCQPCQAWVGTDKNSAIHKPLGTLANEELREARKLAHTVFDPHWKALADHGYPRGKARTQAYRKLAKSLGIELKDCHIAKFDVRGCKDVVVVCNKWANIKQSEFEKYT